MEPIASNRTGSVFFPCDSTINPTARANISIPVAHNHTAQNGRILLAAAILGDADTNEVDIPVTVVREVVVFVPLSPIPVHQAVELANIVGDSSEDGRLDADDSVQFSAKKT